ncbi:MAG: glycosyltransferase family 2 protein [Bacteroides sp.]|nr:glycosyltransferase family 2 protein [Bacteroides sp.]
MRVLDTLVSVVVPVYNVSAYLDACVRSIIEQNYANFELILVNDGSQDNSLAICRRWEAEDRRIRVIDKANGGVSSARNAGIDCATGEWITFIDSDDWVKPDYISFLIESVECAPETVDWVTSGLTYYYADEKREVEAPEAVGLVSSHTADGLLIIAAQKLVTSPVGKLYRRNIMCDNRLRFNPELSYGEDRDFNLHYLSYCANCLITDYNGYCYRKDISTSLSTRKPGNLLKGELDYWSDLYDIFSARKFLTRDVKAYLINRLYNMIIDYISVFSLSTEQVKFIKQQLNMDFIRENRALIEAKSIYRWLFVHCQINFLCNLVTLRTKLI